MRFNIVTILLTLGAGASFVTAAPTEQPNLVARKELTGSCSNGKCSYDGTLYDCTLAGSCVGKDGQLCQGLSATDKRFGCPT